MKKTILIAGVFILAIGSAFTTKPLTNPIGWAKVAGVDRSGPSDNSSCAVNGGAINCYILVGTTHVTPIYDSEAHINVPAFILKRP